MCGVLGLFDSDIEAHKIQAALNLMSHRGPDHQGIKSPQPGVHLGHARLAIQDLNPRSNQPMEYDGVMLSYNGELYNSPEIRSQLQAQGVQFKTSSDTEVFLKAYHTYGPAFIRECRGIFAFIIYDARHQKTFFGRDKYGIKPLYQSKKIASLLLSSDIKPLLFLNPAAGSFNKHALPALFATNYAYTPHLLFSDIKMVPPGQIFEYTLQTGIKLVHDYSVEKDFDNLDEEPFSLDKFEDRVAQTIKRQMISDVPVGIFLSGGLDSGIIAYYLSQFSKFPVYSYSFANPGSDSDEAVMAEKLAAQLGFKHENVQLTDDMDLEDIFKQCIYHYEVPVAYEAALPLYLLAQRARLNNKVILSGDGGDEILGGYTKYQSLFRLKLNLRKWLYFFKYGTRARQKIIERLNIFNHQYRDLFLNEPERELFNHVKVSGLDSQNHMLIFDQKNYLKSMLHKTDSMTMAHSIEARVPFLDEDFSRYMNQQPGHKKVSAHQTKILLRQLGKKVLPAEYVKAPKRGFPVKGIEHWLMSNAKEAVGRFFNHEALQDVLNPASQKTILQKIEAGRDGRQTLLMMKSFIEWYDVFIKEKSFLKGSMAS